MVKGFIILSYYTPVHQSNSILTCRTITIY